MFVVINVPCYPPLKEKNAPLLISTIIPLSTKDSV